MLTFRHLDNLFNAIVIEISTKGQRHWARLVTNVPRRIFFVIRLAQATMFADDTNLTCIGQNSNEFEIKLNEELENVQ